MGLQGPFVGLGLFQFLDLAALEHEAVAAPRDDLAHAIALDRRVIANVLLDAGASLNQRDERHSTALHAAFWRRPEIAKRHSKTAPTSTPKTRTGRRRYMKRSGSDPWRSSDNCWR